MKQPTTRTGIVGNADWMGMLMGKKVFIHGSGHKADSWQETISHMAGNEDILCPELCSLLDGKEASYANLYASFAAFCEKLGGPIHLCGISLGGILALNYALDVPEKTKSLVLIGTPHKIPKAAFGIQNAVFRFLPKSMFESMAFDKKDTFVLGNSMKNLDFSGRVHSITCPTLVICGQKDRANIKSAHDLARQIKGAELNILENTGHVVNEEQPKALADLLTAYYAWND